MLLSSGVIWVLLVAADSNQTKCYYESFCRYSIQKKEKCPRLKDLQMQPEGCQTISERRCGLIIVLRRRRAASVRTSYNAGLITWFLGEKNAKTAFFAAFWRCFSNCVIEIEIWYWDRQWYIRWREKRTHTWIELIVAKLFSIYTFFTRFSDHRIDHSMLIRNIGFIFRSTQFEERYQKARRKKHGDWYLRFLSPKDKKVRRIWAFTL